MIVLNRHCEHLHELSAEEAAALGDAARVVAVGLQRVLQPERIHLGLYAEEVRHLHLHVLPRTAAMPVGNFANVWAEQCARLLDRLGVRHPYSDADVVEAAERLRNALDRQVGVSPSGT